VDPERPTVYHKSKHKRHIESKGEKYMEKRKKWTQIILIGGLVMALALGAMAFIPQAVQAQDEDPETPAAPLFELRGMPGDFERPGKFGFGGDIDYDAYLAEALGISVEELQAARETARAKALEEAVDKGYITEEQLAMMEARNAVMQYIDSEALKEELEALKQEGADLRAELKAVMDEALQAAVDQALENGEIDQDQADQLLEGGLGGKFGGRGGHPGRGGFPRPEFESESDNDL
jgi:polyhydroxyalkanoate synthesis regulator phasin